ncbi:hypothetical protein AlacWU_02547 [Aspergillus niger]|uniref:Transmembrane protein n=2 Tax=Aspergillus niger TaxID=5061 RepID=A2R642_ASPNC|nr:hypothetical protein An15g06570 [Aspergillus niger]GJP89648.1 hypothetical protein AlacWU_02547 [Aspergillus niger]CAK42609.1 hypothetical protein An15g06570 [Aspergillus niger]
MTTTTTTISPTNPPPTTTSGNTPHNIPPYTPMTSLSHELGILFGFLAACFVVMGVYVFFWRGLGLHQRNIIITPENSASAGSGVGMYKENEIGVALTTGMDVVSSPSLGPMTPTSTTVSASGGGGGAAAGREIPVGVGSIAPIGGRMNLGSNVGGVAGGGGRRDEMEYGVEMDVLGFLQRR